MPLIKTKSQMMQAAQPSAQQSALANARKYAGKALQRKFKGGEIQDEGVEDDMLPQDEDIDHVRHDYIDGDGYAMGGTVTYRGHGVDDSAEQDTYVDYSGGAGRESYNEEYEDGVTRQDSVGGGSGSQYKNNYYKGGRVKMAMGGMVHPFVKALKIKRGF